MKMPKRKVRTDPGNEDGTVSGIFRVFKTDLPACRYLFQKEKAGRSGLFLLGGTAAAPRIIMRFRTLSALFYRYTTA